MRVFITGKVPEIAIRQLKAKGYEIVKKLKGVNALLCFLTDRVDGKMMDSAGPQLKIIANMAVGVDNIDLATAKERKIFVTNTPGVLTEATAEHTVALILGLARRLVEGDKLVRSGKFKGWQPDLLLGTELKGKILGIVGHGRIGCKVAEILQNAFKMKVLYYDAVRDKKAEERCGIAYSSLSALLRESDAVSLHVPLLPSTRHLIGLKELRIMKKTAHLINTSRGQVIDEKALVLALKEKWIQGAALDVYEKEPKFAPGLTKLENALLSPHLGSATKEAREAMAQLAAQNIIAAFSGKLPPNLVKI